LSLLPFRPSEKNKLRLSSPRRGQSRVSPERRDERRAPARIKKTPKPSFVVFGGPTRAVCPTHARLVCCSPRRQEHLPARWDPQNVPDTILPHPPRALFFPIGLGPVLSFLTAPHRTAGFPRPPVPTPSIICPLSPAWCNSGGSIVLCKCLTHTGPKKPPRSACPPSCSEGKIPSPALPRWPLKAQVPEG